MANETHGISKKEGVRRALAALGYETSTADLQKYIFDNFKITMNPQHIKNYKSAIRKAGAKAGKIAATKSPAATPTARPAAAHGRTGITLDDVKEVKALAGRLGVSHLKNLVDVLG